jgi:hypothetical protein
MFGDISKKITSTGAWLQAAAKSLDKIEKWPAIDPSKDAALEEFSNSLERAGVRLTELADEIRKAKNG